MTDVAGVRARIERCLAEGDLEGAFAAIAPLASVWERDREAALLALELLRVDPRRERGEVSALARAFSEDIGVSLSVVATLVARAELRPKDEPFTEDGGVAEALAILDALERGPAASAPATTRAHLALARANALRLAGRARDADAVLAFDRAAALAPEDPDVFFDAGLLHKWRGRWPEALDANQRALALGRDDRGVRWNLALAAIALGRGELAAESFRALGLGAEVNQANMPLVAGLSPVEVRVPSRGVGYAGDESALVPDRALSFEVVSVAPLSPCHGVVQSPTLRDAAVDYGDVVLWDLAPLSVRKADDGALVPRFPLLEILRRGDEHRFRFIALEQEAGDVAALGDALGEDAELFPLETRIEIVCPRCAAGETLARHEHLPAEPHRLVRGKVIARKGTDLRELCARIEGFARARGRVKVAVPSLYEALEDPRRAGAEHQAYRGIERVALKRSGGVG
jgi:tetratricopeptide (TPR) repeat protein